MTSSATGLMEAAYATPRAQASSRLGERPGFSERFYKASVNSGIPADKLEVPFGEYVSPELLADTLKQKEYDVVTIVHSETSTGVLNPIRELTAAAHASGDVAVVIDTVSSLAAGAVESDDWELDYVLTGSQKAIALPPGLAFCTANERIFARARQSQRRGLYFDLLEFDEYYRKNQTPNTPAVSLLYALDLQLDHMMAEGVEARWARHAAMAECTRRGQRSGGLALHRRGYRSPGVTCILMPEGTKGSVVVGAMKAKGFVLATGYGALKDDMVRVGHMGEHTLGEVQAVLEALGDVLSL
ncbi:MAG: alanine--glyoxylate aminotransferase family protein [Gemmatimonadetes bacterium]|nr:alanine--glyoxylate aminotransferase family protein [Gemmatimonadota bacterium]